MLSKVPPTSDSLYFYGCELLEGRVLILLYPESGAVPRMYSRAPVHIY